MRELPRYRQCFICGDENRCGTRVTWREATDGIVEGTCLTDDAHCGFEGVMHGGVLTGLLDECIGWAVALRHGAICFTGELTMRFQKPVPTRREIVIRGRSSNAAPEGKRYHCGTGEILDQDGNVYATCEAKFFPMPAELQSEVLARLALRVDPAGSSIASYLWPGPGRSD